VKELRIEYPEDAGRIEIELRVNVGDVLRPGDLVGVVTNENATQEVEAFESVRIVAITRTARGYLLTVDELSGNR